MNSSQESQSVSALVLEASRAVRSLGTRVVQGIVRSTNTTAAGVMFFKLEDEAGARLKCRGRGLLIERGDVVTVRGELTVYGATGELHLDATEVLP